MKLGHNISKETANRVFSAFGAILLLGIAGILVGRFVPGLFAVFRQAPLFFAAVSVGLGAFVWSVFRLIQPVRPNQSWKVAGVVIVPLTWLLLMLAVDVWLYWLFKQSLQEKEMLQHLMTH